jgi:hypothetical protein
MADTDPAQRRRVHPALWALIALFVGAVTFGIVNMLDTPDGPTEEQTAGEMCARFVRQSSDQVTSVTTADTTRLDSGVYQVTGTANGLTGLGTDAATGYTCQVEPVGDGNWTLVSLTQD